MYFITCFATAAGTAESDIEQRTFGFYDNLEDCKSALFENRCDLHECYYDQAVVERIGQGIHAESAEMAWLAWDEEKGGFFVCNKPQWANGWRNFAFG